MIKFFLYYLFGYMLLLVFIFFFNDTATTEIYTLSLHDALPIFAATEIIEKLVYHHKQAVLRKLLVELPDRKSTRLNSSHANISYAVFCLKKKKENNAFLLRVLHPPLVPVSCLLRLSVFIPVLLC